MSWREKLELLQVAELALLRSIKVFPIWSRILETLGRTGHKTLGRTGQTLILALESRVQFGHCSDRRTSTPKIFLVNAMQFLMALRSGKPFTENNRFLTCGT